MWTDWRSFILFGWFKKKTCNVCKDLMREYHNLLAYLNPTKNVGGLSCWIIVNKFFCKPFKIIKWITNLPNHDNLGMSLKYYLNIIYFGL
jgi:hypothetical protein